MPAILKFKRRVVMMQCLIRGFLSRVRNANTHNSTLWDKVLPESNRSEPLARVEQVL